jgi:hypothetical protein
VLPVPTVPPLAAVRYEVAATWEEFVRGANQATTVTRQVEVLLRRGAHYYEVSFTTLAPTIAKRGNLEPLAEVALRLAGLYQQLLLKCSLTGQPLELLNHEDVLRRWQALREDLRSLSPAPDPAIDYLIKFCDQQLQSPASVLQSLQFDYFYQTLLASWVGGAGPLATERTFPQFFPAAGLTFRQQARWQPATTAGLLSCTSTGTLDEQHTDLVALRQQVAAALAGEPAAAPAGPRAGGQPALLAGYQATHLVEEASGLPVHIELTVYARLPELYNKQYTLLLTRL